MKYKLTHCGGLDILLGCPPITCTISRSNEFIAGICSLLYLLYKSVNLTCMIIHDSNNVPVDPEYFIFNYVYDISKNYKQNLIIEHNYLIVKNTETYITYTYENTEFIEGFIFACRLLGRKSSNYIVERSSEITRSCQKKKIRHVRSSN